MTSGLVVYDLYLNGFRVGDDALKPGFTHVQKTRQHHYDAGTYHIDWSFTIFE